MMFLNLLTSFPYVSRIDYLAFVDMLFQPHFDRPFNYVNILGQAAVKKQAELEK